MTTLDFDLGLTFLSLVKFRGPGVVYTLLFRIREDLPAAFVYTLLRHLSQLCPRRGIEWLPTSSSVACKVDVRVQSDVTQWAGTEAP